MSVDTRHTPTECPIQRAIRDELDRCDRAGVRMTAVRAAMVSERLTAESITRSALGMVRASEDFRKCAALVLRVIAP